MSSSASGLPALLKQFGPTLERAKELDRDLDDPDASIIALYCRKHVLEQAAKVLPAKTAEGYAETMKFFLSLMEEVELKKSTISISPEQAHTLCSNYANSLFARAVKTEETEVAQQIRPSRDTAMLFYRANVFLAILGQFEGGLDQETNGRRQHAALKAAQIMKQCNGAAGTATTKPAPPGASAAQNPAAVSQPASIPGHLPPYTPSAAPSPPAPIANPNHAHAASINPLPTPLHSAPMPSAPTPSISTYISSVVFPPTNTNTNTNTRNDTNYTHLGLAESLTHLNTCINELLSNNTSNTSNTSNTGNTSSSVLNRSSKHRIEKAQEALEAAVSVRSLNSKVKDGIELCAFAIAACRREDEGKMMKYVSDARRRLED